MKHIYIAALLTVSGIASADWERAKIMRNEPLNYDHSQASVHLRIPDSIPLRYWATCNYYNEESEVIASTHHVVNERVPRWNVATKSGDIYFVLCTNK